MPEKLFNPDYLKHLCSKYGLVPSKKYGQNFLIDEESIKKMITAATVGPEDTVVEIGPGFGALTFALAEKAKKVMAFEIEKKLRSYWAGWLAQNKNIEIIWGNVLTSLSLRGAISDEAIPKIKRIATVALGDLAMTEPYKVVANLPYQITSEVIRKFLEAKNKPELMVLMVQKEVAERICAKPGDMSVFSVSVQCYAEPEIVAIVPRSHFWPEPSVDSAVIKLSLRGRSPEATDEAIPMFGSANQGIAASSRKGGTPRNDNEQFFKIVKAGFANRRKMLIKNLSSIITKDKLKIIFTEIGLDEKVRAQELSVDEWRRLAAKLSF